MKGLTKDFFKDVWNVPNVLTMLRLVLVPVYIAVYASGYRMTALILFLAASFTDLLDGYLARKNHQITNFGKLMDPLADKVMVLCVMLSQAVSGLVPWPVMGIVAVKELLMIAGGAVMLDKGIVVYSNALGKIAQFTFVAALVLTFFHDAFASWPVALDQALLWAATALTLAALIHYAVRAVKKLKDVRQA